MKTKQSMAKRLPSGLSVQRRTVDGRRVVVLDESEFERLMVKADLFEPLLPEPDADGNYPALEYCRVSMARKIIRDRRRLGLSQADLARRAGIRPESLNRIEQGRVSPTLRTMEKVDKALREAEESATKNGK